LNALKTEMSFRTLPRRQVIITFVGVLLAIFLSTMDQTIVATAMPDIISELGGFAHYTFVTIAYLVTSTVVIPITGRLTDIYGRKWFYTGGIVIFIGGSLGLAIMGTILSHGFTSGFINRLPLQVRAAISPDQLSALAQNPQALISPQSQSALLKLLTSLGAQSDYSQVIQALRESLVSAIAEVFLIALGVMVVAFIINLFIKEIPLRKRRDLPGE
jgi:MFS family permease